MTRFLADIQRAVKLHQAGRLAEAEPVYRAVLAHEPQNAGVLNLLGTLCHQSRRGAEAVRLIGDAVRLSPRDADIRVNHAAALQAEKRFDEARATLEEALKIAPAHEGVRANLGSLLCATARYRDAVPLLRQIVATSPRNAQAWCNLGNALRALGQRDEAIAAYEKALAASPTMAEALVGLGHTLTQSGLPARAVGACHRATQAAPNLAGAWVNLGGALYAAGHAAQGDECLRRGLRLDPSDLRAHSNLLLGLHYDPRRTPEQILAEHQLFGRRFANVPPPPPFALSRDPARRLRVGYVSPDFDTHAVSNFILPLIEAHDRTAVEVIGYYDGHNQDAVTARVCAAADVFRTTAGLSVPEMVALVRADAIDVLVDLAGHTAGNRMAVFGLRAAPVQVTYLGYPDTTGVPAMDYRLTDSVVDPDGADRFCTEKLARVAPPFLCYRPITEMPEVGPLPAGGGGGVTFGCFNNRTKITAEAMGAWARILLAVPASRLILKSNALRDEEIRKEILAAFSAAGVEAGRVELAGFVAPAEHAGWYRRVDLALDTFPYNGTTTTCEALYMGVPVVTLRGAGHVSRVSADLLDAVGLGEFVARDLNEYVAIACQAAGEPARLSGIRAGLRPRMQSSRLMDAPRLAREIEACYRQMWSRWCAAGGP